MRFQDPSRRAVLAVVTLRMSAVAAVLLILADAFQIAVIATQGVNQDQITLDDLVLFLAFLFYLLILVSTVVAFTRWEHRAARNAKTLDPTLRPSPGGAVLWWFVPIGNLVMPYRVLGDIWRASGRDGTTGPAYFGAWWGCWLGGSVLGQLAGRVSADATTAPVALLADVIDLVSNALLLIAALLAIRLVVDLTRRQIETAGQRDETSSSSESASLGPGRLK